MLDRMETLVHIIEQFKASDLAELDVTIDIPEQTIQATYRRKPFQFKEGLPLEVEE